MALSHAKKVSEHFAVYTDRLKIREEYENNIKWTRKIKEAIRDNRIVPYFQPIVNNQTKAVEKYECLIRLIEPDMTVIAPYQFLEIAKRTRLYEQLTCIMIDRCFDQIERMDGGIEFSINLSLKDITNPKTVALIIERLVQAGDHAHNAVFEILESEGIENYSDVGNFIGTIKKYGAKVAIDDFGTGYSNFAHVLKLNVDYLKIDSSLVKNVHNDINSEILIKTIVNFSGELGIRTVSEFVNSEEVLAKIVDLGVDFSQGYYLGEAAA